MNTERATVILAALAAMGTAAVVWQRLSMADADEQLQAVPAANSESNATSAAVNSETEREAAALRAQTRDLAKLRNEVSQLSAQQSELVAARTENAKLLDAKRTGAPVPREVPPGFISKEQLRNAGNETPEDALQTMFWAMREGSLALALQSFVLENGERVHFENLPPEKRAREEEDFKRGGPERALKNFNDFAVLGREQIAEDTVSLHVRSSVSTNISKFQVKRVGAEWKLIGF